MQNVADIPVLEELNYTTSCALPTPWAQFTLHAFVEPSTGKEHLAMTLGDIGDGQPVLARVHSECLTGDVLFSQRCDCGAQLEHHGFEVLGVDGGDPFFAGEDSVAGGQPE